MNFLEGFNSVSNSGPTQAQRGQGPMQSNIQQMLNAPLQGQGMGPMGAQQPMQQPMQQPFGSALGGMGANSAMSAMRGMGAQQGMMGAQQMLNAPLQGQGMGGQQSPWRMSPFQTQGMPLGVPVAQAQPSPGLQPDAYMPQGTSAGTQNFQPQQPGGGFYPNVLNQQPQQAPAPVQQQYKYEMVRYPWYGKAGGEQQDDPLRGYSLQRTGNDYHWQDVPFIERVRQQGLI